MADISAVPSTSSPANEVHETDRSGHSKQHATDNANITLQQRESKGKRVLDGRRQEEADELAEPHGLRLQPAQSTTTARNLSKEWMASDQTHATVPVRATSVEQSSMVLPVNRCIDTVGFLLLFFSCLQTEAHQDQSWFQSPHKQEGHSLATNLQVNLDALPATRLGPDCV